MQARHWDRSRAGNFSAKKHSLLKRIEGVERARTRKDNQYLLQAEKNLWLEYNKTLSQEELFWFQKSRCNWLKWGDRNSKFFHTSTIIRRRRNQIEGLRNSTGDWVFNQDDLKSLALSYYKNLFLSDADVAYGLNTRHGFPNLSQEEHLRVSTELEMEEIKQAVFDLGAYKAPGPDGIQAFLYHQFWGIIGQPLCEMIKEIFHDPLKVREINDTNIALIPKVDHPEFITDFRPISLCNVSYKVVSKIISNRLRGFMDKLIGHHQCSFIAGRQSSDNIIIAQEVIHSMKNKKGSKGWLAVKVDLEKAFDRLEWSFIKDTLEAVGLTGKICDLIMACISTSSLQVLWNGEPTNFFSPSRGIRQGDPISPYIFTLCMERLSHIISDAISEKSWAPIQLSRGGPPISHLFFADDLILFGDASPSQVDIMVACLDRFCHASGQKMNKNKTKMCFSRNIHASRRIELSRQMGVGLTADLGKYLGIPLVHKRASYVTFAPILEKTKKRLAGWKKGTLTLAGRATLIKSVLSALPSYFMQTMLLPKRVVYDLEKSSRGFLWGDKDEGKKIHLMSWDNVTQEKLDGGLGIKNLEEQNKAFIMKLCWGLTCKRESLWVKVLRNKYGCGDHDIPDVAKKQNASLTWRGICAVWSKFRMGIGQKIGNGRKTLFWLDNWSDFNRPLIEVLMGYEDRINPGEFVVYYVMRGGGWDRCKLERCLPNHIVDRIICMHPPCEARGEDKVIWKPSTDGCFSVKSAYCFLSTGTLQRRDNIWRLLWRWQLPEKIKTFMWLVVHDRVHTRHLRATRGLLSDASCPFGCNQEEDVMHLLRDCPHIKPSWESALDQSFRDQFWLLQGSDWVKWNLKHEAGRPFTKKIPWPLLFGYLCWDIWVSRCNKLFQNHDIQDRLNPNHSFMRACADVDILRLGGLMTLPITTRVGTWDQDEDSVNLFVDGSVLADGRSSCGGYVRDHQGNWLEGFSCKLSNVPPVIAEIIGCLYGLNVCWARGLKKVILYSDCFEAINFGLRGCDESHPYKDIIDDFRLFIHRDWQVTVSHVYREANTIADRLADFAHSLSGSFCLFDQPPPFIQEADVDEG